MDRSFLINDTIRRPNKDLIESDHLPPSSEIIDKNSTKENDYKLLNITSKADSKKYSNPSIV